MSIGLSFRLFDMLYCLDTVNIYWCILIFNNEQISDCGLIVLMTHTYERSTCVYYMSTICVYYMSALHVYEMCVLNVYYMCVLHVDAVCTICVPCVLYVYCVCTMCVLCVYYMCLLNVFTNKTQIIKVIEFWPPFV